MYDDEKKACVCVTVVGPCDSLGTCFYFYSVNSINSPLL